MNIQHCARVVFASLLTMGPMLPALGADTAAVQVSRVAYGAIVGRVTNAAKLPVEGATVTAARVDGAAIRATLSAGGGIYSFADLAPGAWVITVQAEGAPDLVLPAVDVVSGKATRNDFVLNVPATPPAMSPALAGVSPAPVSQPLATFATALQAPAAGPTGWMPTICKV